MCDNVLQLLTTTVEDMEQVSKVKVTAPRVEQCQGHSNQALRSMCDNVLQLLPTTLEGIEQVSKVKVTGPRV